MSKKLIICLLGAVVCGPAAFATTYTGDVPADFTATGVQSAFDGTNYDVGLPYNAPSGTVSGWDVRGTYFELDKAGDKLYVGVDFFGIAGDADGDGVEGVSSLWLSNNGGFDLPSMALTESACIAFDFNQDAVFDVIAGYNANDGTYRLSTFVGNAMLPSFGFGPVLPAINDGGHVLGPDLELTLSQVSDLWDTAPQTVCFDFLVFAGSYQDDGIGEDYFVGTVCFEDTQVAAVTPKSMDMVQAYPNPFNPTTTLAVDLAATGNVQLAVYNINGQLVRTLVDGMMESGKHQVAFDGAGLPSGLYLARLSTAQGEQVTRLVLTK